MFQDKYVFAQLASFLNRSKFNRIVTKYDGDKYVKHFTCWNQLLALIFGQLSNRESLRDLIVALEAHHSKCYHLGMGKNVSKSSLARANQDRDYHIFEEYAYYLVSEARQKCANHIFKLGGNVYAFDSTTIDLCLSVFWWAKFRKKKGGIKVHTLCFKHWGHYGACENGEVYYDAKIALWECDAPEHPESREWFKIHIRKNTRPGGDMYTGKISCKDEDGLRQFVDDHEGFIFAEEGSPEMVMLCFRHSDMRISPEEWEKMDCPVSVREIYGQMQEVKIVKDHKTHLTTFYY